MKTPKISAVSVKDTIGAGDSFTATMVMGRLYGLPLKKINRLASKVATYVCSQAGASPTFPDEMISELKQEISRSIQEVANTIPAPTKRKYNLDKTDHTIL